MRRLIVIAHNLRSAHNVGSLLRTAEGLGVEDVILSGYTPYPAMSANDPRLPHEQAKISRLISKTALGAEQSQTWHNEPDIWKVLDDLRSKGFVTAALEQSPDSVSLPDYLPPDKLVIILGRERDGLEADILSRCDVTLEIPMLGKKESYNVVQAAAMALYHCRFIA